MFGTRRAITIQLLTVSYLFHPLQFLSAQRLNGNSIASIALHSNSIQVAQGVPNQCDPDVLAAAEPIDAIFTREPIQIINDTPDGVVARRLGYFFQLDSHLRRLLEQAFATGLVSDLDVTVVSQQELYQVQAEAQNLFNGATGQATIWLADHYVIGDYETQCTLSLTGIENEFSEVLLRARYYTTYRQELRPSVFQESATLALSSLISLLLQGEMFNSAEEARIFLQDTLARSQRSYADRANLPLSSSDQESAFIAAWLNERLSHLLPSFTDGTVEFIVDTSAGMGNVIKPVVIIECENCE